MLSALDANGDKLIGVQKGGDTTTALTGVRAPDLDPSEPTWSGEANYCSSVSFDHAAVTRRSRSARAWAPSASRRRRRIGVAEADKMSLEYVTLSSLDQRIGPITQQFGGLKPPWVRESCSLRFCENTEENRQQLDSERVGFFDAVCENPNEYGRFRRNAREVNDLASSNFCRRLLLVASVGRFYQRDVTRNVTRRARPGGCLRRESCVSASADISPRSLLSFPSAAASLPVPERPLERGEKYPQVALRRLPGQLRVEHVLLEIRVVRPRAGIGVRLRTGLGKVSG